MIHVRFVGAEGKYQSIETQAVRIHRHLEPSAPGRVKSSLTLLPQDHFRPRGFFRRPPCKELESLLDGVDVLVVVKSSLFKDFGRWGTLLRELCDRRGVVLASNPCDGPGADAGDTTDDFTEKQADFALAVSRLQAEAIARRRPGDQVFLVGHASRIETRSSVEYRDTVRQVIWENAIHHNPRYDPRKVGMPRERYQELEDLVRGLATERGAKLVFIEAWRETQTYAEWEAMMLSSDIAIECKALGNSYVDYQSQKPAVKVLNYMSLGLPVVCDTLPAYKELGEHGRELLFANSLEEWKRELTRLFDDVELRRSLGTAARKAAEPLNINNICRRHVELFEQMVQVKAARRKGAPARA